MMDRMYSTFVSVCCMQFNINGEPVQSISTLPQHGILAQPTQ